MTCDGDVITLREAGMALYGLEWKGPLARELGIDVRTMRRWANGEFTIPEAIWPAIGRMCRDTAPGYRQRAQELEKLARDLSD